MERIQLILFFLALCFTVSAREYHVARTGNDDNSGALKTPLLTIQAAANIARPGDIITVHKGTERHWYNALKKVHS